MVIRENWLLSAKIKNFWFMYILQMSAKLVLKSTYLNIIRVWKKSDK